MSHIVILAAGKGTRMKSSKAKVLQLLAGRPMLNYVIDTATQYIEDIKTKANTRDTHINIVVGHKSEEIKAYFADAPVNWVEQKYMLGTADAVKSALPYCESSTQVIVLFGDVPLITPETLKKLSQRCNNERVAIVTVDLANPFGYGRMVRNKDNAIFKIVEERDATPDEKKINEVNSGIMAIPTTHLKDWLNRINDNNKGNEYYLTDIVELAVEDGVQVVSIKAKESQEVLGINNRMQQATVEKLLQKRKAEKLMEQGLTLMDPERFDLRGDLTIGTDVVIDINCIFEGSVFIGDNVTIGAGCIIKNTTINTNATIHANSMLDKVTVGNNAQVGPFARLRPGTELAQGVKVGNFVEIKNSTLDKDTKVSHLSYIGDSSVGSSVNIGAGTITCNYDGKDKNRTTIEENVFIGSNTSLVAPITIGNGAFIGAGSTITKSVAPKSLAIGRARQKTIKKWLNPSDSKNEKKQVY